MLAGPVVLNIPAGPSVQALQKAIPAGPAPLDMLGSLLIRPSPLRATRPTYAVTPREGGDLDQPGGGAAMVPRATAGKSALSRPGARGRRLGSFFAMQNRSSDGRLCSTRATRARVAQGAHVTAAA